MLNAADLTPDQCAGLEQLHAWKGVRERTLASFALPLTLEAAGWLKRVHTPIGDVLTLSLEGRVALEKIPWMPSDSQFTDAVYIQDGRGALSMFGYRRLSLSSTYYTVRNEQGSVFPVLGKLTSQGYSARTIKAHLSRLEPDLLARGVKLIVLAPTPRTLNLQHARLQVVFAPPLWHP